MNAWDTYHHRSALLRGIVVELDGGAGLPWNDELADAFADRDGLLVALHSLWARRVMARVDLALELRDIPAASVIEAWQAVVAELPGVHRVLRQHRDLPALARPTRNLYRMVAVAAGVATLETPAAGAAAAGEAFLSASPQVVVPARRDGWLRERLSFGQLKVSA